MMAPAVTPSHPPQPAVSSLSPKPCRTCGRIITPRSKWAKNWDEIKFCSDSCRTWRSTVVYRPRKPESSEVETGSTHPSTEQQQHPPRPPEVDVESLCLEGSYLGFFPPQPQSQQLQRSQQSQSHSSHELFHLEAWLESLLLFHSIPSTSSPKQARKKLEDVELAIDSQLQPLPRSSPPHLDPSAPTPEPDFCKRLLETKPGRREILRRTARKLVVFPFSDLALCKFAESTGKSQEFLAELRGRAEKFELWQGSKRVGTLEGVSYAKGTLELGSG